MDIADWLDVVLQILVILGALHIIWKLKCGRGAIQIILILFLEMFWF
jgi:hypothetical protein